MTIIEEIEIRDAITEAVAATNNIVEPRADPFTYGMHVLRELRLYGYTIVKNSILAR